MEWDLLQPPKVITKNTYHPLNLSTFAAESRNWMKYMSRLLAWSSDAYFLKLGIFFNDTAPSLQRKILSRSLVKIIFFPLSPL